MSRSPSLLRILGDPYALSPNRDAEPELGNEADLRGAEFSEELDTWLGPFVMASVNTRVVRRSNALRDWAYGRRFRYREVMAFGSASWVAGRRSAWGAASRRSSPGSPCRPLVSCSTACCLVPAQVPRRTSCGGVLRYRDPRADPG